MTDFWDDAAGQEVEAPPKGNFEGPPNDTRGIFVNTTSENGGAAPAIKTIEGKDGVFRKFKTGLIIVGGEAKMQPFKGRYVFLETYIHKRPDDTTKTPLSGALYNLMLDMLAPEGNDVGARWAVCLGVLKAKAQELGLTIEQFGGDGQLFLATLFKEVLSANQFKVIGRTYTPKKREGSTFEPSQTVGSIEAYTPEVCAKRKVGMFDVNTDF